MRQTSGRRSSHGEKIVKDIRRATRKQYSAEEKIRIVLDGAVARPRKTLNYYSPAEKFEECVATIGGIGSSEPTSDRFCQMTGMSS